MTHLMILINDRPLSGLREEAERLGLSVEQLAQMVLERHAEDARKSPASQEIDTATFQQAMKQSLEENDELYRRLAQ
jgi:chorismate mutase